MRAKARKIGQVRIEAAGEHHQSYGSRQSMGLQALSRFRHQRRIGHGGGRQSLAQNGAQIGIVPALEVSIGQTLGREP